MNFSFNFDNFYSIFKNFLKENEKKINRLEKINGYQRV